MLNHQNSMDIVMYKIGDMSKLCKLPVKTLRYYADEGILLPDEIDLLTGYRYYSASKIADCYRILALKNLGFTHDEIKLQMNMHDNDIFEMISKKQQELINDMDIIEKQIRRMEQIKTAINKEEHFMYNIIVRKSDSIRTAYQRQILNSKDDIDYIIHDMKNSISTKMQGSRCIVIDYETEFNLDSYDTGVCVEIVRNLPNDCVYSEKLIEFDNDTMNLVCNETQYDSAMLYIHQYCNENKYQIVGATYKILYDDDTIELKIPVCRLSNFSDDFNQDEINVEFINDENVIGRWELTDVLYCEEQFNPEKPKINKNEVSERIKELYFLPNGERYWCFSWTKGYLISQSGYPATKGLNPYKIKMINNVKYMILEMKFGDYFYRKGKPEIWILKQIDNIVYNKEEISVRDNIDLPFMNDETILGKWTVCDLVQYRHDFNPEKPNPRFPKNSLFWTSAEFFEYGNCINTFNDGSISDSPVFKWTKDIVICTPRETASQYIIKSINHIDYLIIHL